MLSQDERHLRGDDIFAHGPRPEEQLHGHVLFFRDLQEAHRAPSGASPSLGLPFGTGFLSDFEILTEWSHDKLFNRLARFNSNAS